MALEDRTIEKKTEAMNEQALPQEKEKTLKELESYPPESPVTTTIMLESAIKLSAKRSVILFLSDLSA